MSYYPSATLVIAIVIRFAQSAFMIIFFVLLVEAGWKLTPMVGAMYSPELYTGTTAKMITAKRGKKRAQKNKSSLFLSVVCCCRRPRCCCWADSALIARPLSVPGFPYPAAAAAAASTAATFRGALRGRARPVYSAVRAAVPQPAIPTYPG